jgi:mannosyl-3-phosphoglycerate phosphatase
MKIRAVFTDLDGTLLEPDMSVHRDVPGMLARLAAAGVPVCPVTSKTPAELGRICRGLGVTAPGGFENGAGIWQPGGQVRLGSSAVPVAELRRVIVALRARTGVELRSLSDLTDRQLAVLTGLRDNELAEARQRLATVPLLVNPAHDERLRAALPAEPRLRLLRGNRFLHLQGDHDKGDAVGLLLRALGPGEGVTVACGDAPNDVELLAAADVPVIVPSGRGPHPRLVKHFPHALVAPYPHGQGWAGVLCSLLEDHSWPA